MGAVTLSVYLADIRLFSAFEQKGMEILPNFRRSKAQKYKKREDRLLSMCAGLMLSHYLGIQKENQLSYNAYGKPELTDGKHFSLSHSGDYAVLVFHEKPIGIDIEKMRTCKEGIEKRIFTPQEQAWVQDSQERFFSLWTRKEAVTKALGTGLHMPANSICVLEECVDVCDERLFLHTLCPSSDYMLSVASVVPAKIKLVRVLPADIF